MVLFEYSPYSANLLIQSIYIKIVSDRGDRIRISWLFGTHVELASSI